MALEGASKDNDVKVRFNIREGIYKQMPISEYFYPKRVPYVNQGPASTSTTVKTSITRIDDGDEDCDRVCFTVGRELFYFGYKSLVQPSQHLEFLDKRTYKGVQPTCHHINKFSASNETVKVAVGFTAGQVQVIDVKTKQSLQIMNEDRSVEKSRVTCVKWLPESENVLLSAHASGNMYTYDVSQPSTNALPIFHTQPHILGEGYTIYALKTKTTSSSTSSNGNGNNATTKNPLFKWIMATDGSGIHTFQFSPCGRFVAVAMQNGYLRVINHSTFEMHGCMKSYFGGLLSCSWSPDGRYIVTGGEDDLVNVWSFCEKCVIARGYGHRSWVSEVSFDPFCCFYPNDSDMKMFYGMPSVADLYPKHKALAGQDCANNNSCENVDNPTHSSTGMGDFVQRNNFSEDSRPHCNGEVGLMPHSNMRRLRTYSNVSKFSRLSIGLDPCSPPICYRFGSVGQDAHLCLWEIDENILFNSRKNRPTVLTTTQKRRPSVGSGGDCSAAYNSTTDSGSEVPVNGSSNSEYSSNGSYGQYHYYNNISGGNIDVSQLVTTAQSSNASNSGTSATLNLQKDKKHSRQNASNGVASKFATLGSHERKNKEGKEHKRNLSLPHFSFRSTSNQNGGASTKYGILNKKAQPPQLIKTLGTTLCPKLDETTLLEPLVCKKIAQSRITGINFMEDCIITTCQDGYLQLWKRPNPRATSPSPDKPK
uniref:WD repeat-containing protein 20 n=1 Tax=Phallusia mammillata TaxID=59560 RepID=A0A6F9DXC2_9ASCI|nr:WD repeat-containing protein 20 [Phallusia mammillata]